MENQSFTTKLYFVYDKVEEKILFTSLANNDQSFIRDNLNFIRSHGQIKDFEIRKCPIPDIRSFETVGFDSYRFDDESVELARLGLKDDEIEAYFAERSKKNRGITEKQIISIMQNFIANNTIKSED